MVATAGKVAERGTTWVEVRPEAKGLTARLLRGGVIRHNSARLLFKNSQPFVACRDGQPRRLTAYSAAVWLELSSRKSVWQLANGISRRYKLDGDFVYQAILPAVQDLYRNGLIELSEQSEPTKFPLRSLVRQCHFALTHECNLHCKHCLICRKTIRELSTQEILDALKALRLCGCQLINFSGGEPLLRRDFPIIIRSAHGLGLRFGFNTNSTLIDSRCLALLDLYRPENIGISLYGDSEDIHDRITRVKGSFKRTVNQIRSLVRGGLNVTIKTMVMQENHHRLKEISKIAATLNCPVYFDAHILPRRDGSQLPLKCRLTGENLRAFWGSDFVHIPKHNNGVWQDPNRLICSAGFDRCAIDPYGQVFPCAAFPMSLGSLREKPLPEILGRWHRDRVLHVPTAGHFQKCLKCRCNIRCFPCPGFSFIEEGSQERISRWICASNRWRWTNRKAA